MFRRLILVKDGGKYISVQAPGQKKPTCLKTLGVFAALMTLYVSIIVGMYDPSLVGSLDEWVVLLPGQFHQTAFGYVLP
ncbi:hypothetical protein FACS18949_14760 [Clostridia bacterium]|nr:hypothetical protein FACS18949_14760 [Clostridia bacterium]